MGNAGFISRLESSGKKRVASDVHCFRRQQGAAREAGIRKPVTRIRIRPGGM